MFIEGQLWNIKRCWFCLNSQEGSGLHKRSPSSYAGLLALGKEGKRLRAWDWQLATPATPFKNRRMSKSGVIGSILIQIQRRTTFLLSFIFAALHGDDFQAANLPMPAFLFFRCQLSCSVWKASLLSPLGCFARSSRGIISLYIQHSFEHPLLTLIEWAPWFNAFPRAVITVIAGVCFGKMGKS